MVGPLILTLPTSRVVVVKSKILNPLSQSIFNGSLTLNNDEKLVSKFIEWFKKQKPEYESWNVKYYSPLFRMKLSIPEGLDLDKKYKLSKIIGLSFLQPEFKEIIKPFKNRDDNDTQRDIHPLFSENLWWVDEEKKHQLIVGYIFREVKTVIILHFWLSKEGMYDIINSSPIGVLLFPIQKKDEKKQATEKLYKILQTGVGDHQLIVADLDPFKDVSPLHL